MRHRPSRAQPLRASLRSSSKAAVSIACVAALVGCNPSSPTGGNSKMYPGSFDPWGRVDHIHSDADQQKATEAAQTFENPVGVLADAVDQDLNALTAYQRTVAAANEKLHETIFADLTTSMTWNRMRSRLLRDLGIDPGIYSGDYAWADRDADVTARIILRQQKVATVIHLLSLIHATQAALVQQGAENLDAKTSPTPLNAPTAAADKTTLDRAQWAQCLFSTIVNAAKGFTEYGKGLEKATAEQQRLLGVILKSEDPSKAFVLVAVVGTGLDNESFTLLDAYIEELNGSLGPIKSSIGTVTSLPTSHPPTPADHAWQAVGQSYDNFNDSLTAFQKVRKSEVEAKGDKGTQRRKDWNALKLFIQNSPEIGEEELRRQRDRDAAIGEDPFGKAGVDNDQSPQMADAARASSIIAGPTTKSTSIAYKQEATPLSVTGRRLLDRQVSRHHQVKLFNRALNSNVEKPNGKPLPLPGALTWRARAQLDEDQKDKNTLTTNVMLWRAAVEDRLVDASLRLDEVKSNASHASKATKAVIPRAVADRNFLVVKARQDAQSAAANPAQANSKQLATSSTDCSVNFTDLTSLLGGNVNAIKGFNLLSAVVASQPSLAKTLQNEVAKGVGKATKSIGLTDGDLKFFGQVAGDIDSQQQAANQRVLSMLQELLQVNADMNQENLRHTEFVETIANLELKRWLMLGTLDENYSEVFDLAGQTARDPDRPQSYPLFFAEMTPGWPNGPAAPTTAPTTGPAPTISTQNRSHDPVLPDSPIFNHPAILPTDRIYPSIIQLLQTARAWHDVSLAQSTPQFANQLDVADRRLYLAVRTVQGHLLMSALNRKQGDENAIRLVHELALHQNQLDDLHARVEEAGLRLNLRNIRAFTETGITQSDVQATVQAATDVYLGLTASKVFK